VQSDLFNPTHQSVTICPITSDFLDAPLGSRFVVFEKSGHLPFFEEPAKFVQVVGEFLGAGAP